MIQGHYKAKYDDLAKPGDFTFGVLNAIGETCLYYVCPCGQDKTQHQGGFCAIRIGLEKPQDQPSWKWDGNRTKPTLTPSINDKGCGWHGYLTAGEWKLVGEA